MSNYNQNASRDRNDRSNGFNNTRSGGEYRSSERERSDERRAPYSRGRDESGRGAYGSERRNSYSNSNPRREYGNNRPYEDNEVNDEQREESIIAGRNAVRELFKTDRTIDKVFVRKGDREGSIIVLIAIAKEKGIPVVEVDKVKLDNLASGQNHQGIVAMAAAKEYSSIEDILEYANSKGEKPVVIVADGVEDPHNLGAIIRCAEGAGAHGVIIPKRRASGLTAVVSKASAGAIEHVRIAKVANIASTIDVLKKAGLWVFAADVGGKPYYECDFKSAVAIVLGGEGDGISELVKKKCDFVATIPMYGEVNSLNVSTASAVILNEVARQMRQA